MAPIGTPTKLVKTRYHGDFHLGQILVAENDFYILDFEGEPRRNLAQRRIKHTSVKDVAGMLRSFDYAAWAALDHQTRHHPDQRAQLRPYVLQWRDAAQQAFLAEYRERMVGCPAYPADEQMAADLLKLTTLEKLFYEIGYELANRPTWVWIPLAGAENLLLRAT